MTDAERREAARQFYQKWANRGKEDEDDRSYWIDFLWGVMGVDHVTDRIEFQKKVVGPDGNTKRIDAYIPETRVLIEQKSLNVKLDKPQAGHDNMTPYQQAKMYDNSLPYDEKARWIILSNFAEIWVYDMNARIPEPLKISLADIQTKYSLFDFLTNKKQQKISQEVEISVKAGEFVGLIYDALLKQYVDPTSEKSLKSLNMLCVRLVFCLYAEDAHIFGDNGHMFHDYMEQFETRDMRKALKDLFETLNTPVDKRDQYDSRGLLQFPYVNGGLFAEENIEIPNFTDEIRDILLEKASEGFDWSMISPTIFGAVFESTLNPETRRSGGMHYTSIENIHKVVDPLFLDNIQKKFDSIFFDTSQEPTFTEEEKLKIKAFQEEEAKARESGDKKTLDEIKKAVSALKAARTKKSNYSLNQQIDALDKLQEEIASLKFLDPACGSGNFLTESYISLRQIENEIIRKRIELKANISSEDGYGGQISFGEAINPIKVSISQFYGIEINDFAVTVAKTALWIAESQMMKETEDIIHVSLDFLPLKTNATIIEGNALHLDWNSIVRKEELNYVMGNPPFVGCSLQSKEQKADIISVYADEKGRTYKYAGKIDYVSGWYYKAAQYIWGTSIRAAFVSTNSITQGEQVSFVWKPLYERFGIEIVFAYRTFIWNSEASVKAHVHCVIIGFQCSGMGGSINNSDQQKRIFDGGNVIQANNINAYLLDTDNIFVESRSSSLCETPSMCKGFQATDNGYLILNQQERDELLSKEPNSQQWIRQYSMGVEFINNIPRYCLWLKDITPNELRNTVEIKKRVSLCKEWREKSTPTGDAYKLKHIPHLFRPCKQFKDASYIAIPLVSSSNRRYMPMAYITNGMIPGNNLFCVFDASLYHFGILISNVHMAWIRAVGGFLKSDWRYSKDIVYNNFPWPEVTDEQREAIEKTAQGVIDARALYPDSSLADLYDPLTMPSELLKAHIANDRAVMTAYDFNIRAMSEADCVTELMKMYQELVTKDRRIS